MSEATGDPFLNDAPADAIRAARQLLDEGGARALAERLFALLAGEPVWRRARALEVLRGLPPHPPLLQALIEGLRDERSAERRNGARSALAALATPGAADPGAPLPHLEELLRSDPDPDVRILAALALGESGNPRARPALEEALADADPNVAAASAEALGILGDPRALDALARLADGEELWTRTAAVVALGELGDARAVPVLARAISEPWLAAVAAAALGAIGDPGGLAPLQGAVRAGGEARREGLGAAAQILGRNPGLATPPWVREALRESHGALARRFAEEGDAESARLLGLSGTEEAAWSLLEQVSAPGRRAAAVVGLEHLPPELRGAAILGGLAGAEPRDRVVLLDSLPPLSAPEAIRRVGAFLSDPDPEVRGAAAEALGRSDEERVLEELDRLRPEPEARLGVAQAYGRLGSNRCGALLELLHDADPRVRAAAARGMARCGLGALAPVRTALDRETDPHARRALVTALGAEGGAEAVERLSSLLGVPEVGLRFDAVQALGRTREESALPALLQALADPVPEIRIAALRALGELGDARAERTLSDYVEAPDRDHRRVAARALDRLAGPSVRRRLIDTLRDPDREVRMIAVAALGQLRAPEAAAALARVAEEDPDPLVRRAAARALTAAGDQAGTEAS